MSREFSSEEYEEKEVVYEDTGPVTHDADTEIVFRFSAGRDVSDPSFPFQVGMNFLEGREGFFQSDEMAVKWLRRASKSGYAASHSQLARLLLKDTKTYGYTEAATEFGKARDCGEAVPELDTSGVTDPSKRSAFTVYRLNAELGDAECAYRLADGFQRGLYGKDKSAAAAKWFRIAFRRGCGKAADRLLAMSESGEVKLTDGEKEAFRK